MTVSYFNPLTAKLLNRRDPQLEIWQNGSQLFSNRAKWCYIMALTCLKGGTECSNNWMKNLIYSGPAVKGLRYMYQYTASVPAFSDIDGGGPRAKAYIL